MLAALKRRRAAAPPSVIVPAGERVYAIGDVHGRLDLLEQLLARIEDDERDRAPARRILVLLGDLIDRGPASAGVVARAMELVAGGDTHVLKGNHEEMLVGALDGDPRALRMLMRNGGIETLESYGISFKAQEALADEDVAMALLAEHVPVAHADFLRDLPDQLAIGDYLFVHAGVRPGVPLDQQRPADLRWIRDPFLDHDGFHGAMIVHGHSISGEPELRSNRLGIDTGAYATGRLTALGLEDSDRWLLQTEVAQTDR